MLSKKEYLIKFLENNNTFICPLCKENLKTIEYDATLEYNNGTSIIAVDEKALDDYLVAISNKNEKKINYMIDNLQISKVINMANMVVYIKFIGAPVCDCLIISFGIFNKILLSKYFIFSFESKG